MCFGIYNKHFRIKPLDKYLAHEEYARLIRIAPKKTQPEINQ